MKSASKMQISRQPYGPQFPLNSALSATKMVVGINKRQRKFKIESLFTNNNSNINIYLIL